MGKKKGHTLAGHLVDSLLDKNSGKGSARSSPPEEIDIHLNLEADEASVATGLPKLPNATEEPAPLNEPPDGSIEVERFNTENKAEDKTFAISPTASVMPSTPSIMPQASPNEATIRLSPEKPTVDAGDDQGIRVGFGHLPNSSNTIDARLAQAESVRIAQARILQLEVELERLRRENDELASAGDLLRRKADEMTALKERAERRQAEIESILQEEKSVYRSHISAKDSELITLRTKVEELELRLQSDFKRIRVRERDLEHRLEMLKIENVSTSRTKDELILESKRRIDQLTAEAENHRQKSQELHRQLENQQDTLRRVVRALRLALSTIEGEDDPKKGD